MSSQQKDPHIQTTEASDDISHHVKEEENEDSLSDLDVTDRTFYIALDNTSILLAELFARQIPDGTPFHMPNFTVSEGEPSVDDEEDIDELGMTFAVNLGTEEEQRETWKATVNFAQKLQEASMEYSEEYATEDGLRVTINPQKSEVSLSIATIECAMEITRYPSDKLEIANFDTAAVEHTFEKKGGKSLQQIFQDLNLDNQQRDLYLQHMPPKPYLSVAQAFCTAHSNIKNFPENGLQDSFERIEAQIQLAYGESVPNPGYTLH